MVEGPTSHVPPEAAKSPTYPQRAHIRERAHWQGVFEQWDQRVKAAASALAQKAAGPGGDEARLAYIQMQGACDQIAEAVRRLPMEVGNLYEEDRHRVESAVAALERLFQRWDGSR